MNRVALIVMPWASVRRGSIALGILQRALRRRRIPSDTYYLNLRLAARMNLQIYESVANLFLVGDWFFSQSLFGPYGDGETAHSLANTYADLVRGEGPNVLGFLARKRVDFDRIGRVIVPAFLEECLAEIPWERYAIAAFTSVYAQQVPVLTLARRLKDRFPGMKTVIGGANVAGPMGLETLRAFPWIDYAVDGEAEDTFPRLAAELLAGRVGKGIPGVSRRRNGEVVPCREQPAQVDLGRVPIPEYTPYFRQLEETGLAGKLPAYLQYESARGCWWGEKHQCTFCGMNALGLTFRTKPARRVLREIRALTRRHRCLNLDATDNVLHTGFFSDLFPRISEQGWNLDIFYEIRANLTRPQAVQMRRAGVRYIQIGIESLHTDLLRKMRKGTTALQNVQALKWCAEEGIFANWNLLYGFPGENRRHYEQILDTTLRISHLQAPAESARLVVQRHSAYFQDPARWGITDLSPKRLYHYIYPAERVRLPDIAYHFDYSANGAAADSDSYLRPVMEAALCWQQAFTRKQIVCQYRRGPGFLEITDNRPMAWGENRTRRQFQLTGLKAGLLEFCSPIRSFATIAAHAGTSPGGEVSKEDTRQALEEMVADRLMIAENGCYLSLPLPADQAGRQC